jgi:2-amino-4-hydroxy-6-hydroxymethyldihydropteridine diphosphokinase
MHKVFISLGSSIGKREEFLTRAREELKKIGKLSHVSGIYETEPLGDSPLWFLNQVVLLETDLTPKKLLAALKVLEKKLGRVLREKWSEREIDLDILFYDSNVVDLPELQIPHREIPKRNFVLVPMVEIAPEFIHPGLGKTMRELLESSPDNLQVTLWIPKK